MSREPGEPKGPPDPPSKGSHLAETSAARCAETDVEVTVVLGVEYDGHEFSGFQRQSHAPSVQAALESAASEVAATPIRMVVAGRTDAGVHATQQVVSFRTKVRRPLVAWQRGITSLTPAGVGVVWARTAPEEFHARFSALWRRYVYVYSDADPLPILLRHQVAWSRVSLNARAMHDAAQALVGEHDFSAFRAANCQSKSPWRRVLAIKVSRPSSRLVVIDIAANAFLQHMVRNIAGALREVGQGRLTCQDFRALFASRDRTLGPATAAPGGLYLVGVGYPDWELPARMPLALAC